MKLAGLYIHIPFCRQACRYCDFHFSVSLHFKEKMLKAMESEMLQKARYFKDIELKTLYFGGGTPSVLSNEEIVRLILAVKNNFQVSPDLEITFEANPDDLTIPYLEALKRSGIARLSIGVQSFRDKDLELMRRSHNAIQAIEAVKNAKQIGFDNINCDLIYGIPGMNSEDWKENLHMLFELRIRHISAYHLTFEPGTVFEHWRKKQRIFPVEEAESVKQFKVLKSETTKSGFIHYEISNFARPGFFSQHNLIYWTNKTYVGIGPSAHSFDGKRRFWNISSNKKYIQFLLSGGNNYTEGEDLSKVDLYNEYILTSLRTMWGIDLNEIHKRFEDNYVKYLKKSSKRFLESGDLIHHDNKIRLSDKGVLKADYVIREFFLSKNHSI